MRTSRHSLLPISRPALLLGSLLLTWMIDVLFEAQSPDLGLVKTITPASLGIVLALGVVAVTAAPLLTVRKLNRMNIPATLRIRE